MVARKRGRTEMEAGDAPQPQAPSMLQRLRNLWIFSNVMQFIWTFGAAFKIDEDFDVEDLEDECLKPGPHHKLLEIGLCLLKAVSSQRGLTTNDFDEYTSRQYKKKLPERANPFGDEELPKRFLDFDTVTQLRVLHQLSLWTLMKPLELRERMKRKEDDPQTDWRIDPVGWDRDERTYFLLDDGRLYRRTDPAIPSAFEINKPKTKAEKPKARSAKKFKAQPKPARAGTRTSKRLKVSEEKDDSSEVEEPQQEDEEEETSVLETNAMDNEDEDLGGGYRWECVAITVQEYQQFLESVKKSRDPNEKLLYKFITDEIMPMMEKQEENRQKRIAKRQRELLNMEKMANAKRSSRIADKAEREREENERFAVEAKRQRDLAAARADEERKKKMEEARESRMMTREQRLKEREYKRILHEEELANMSEDSKKVETGELKVSERRLKADMIRKQKELEALQQAEEDWVFDCAGCGVYGENMDDGSPIISCERCNVWQHLLCLGISQTEADREDFHFICKDCHRREREAKQREEDAKKPKIPPLKFRYDPTVELPADVSPTEKRKRGRPRKHPLADGTIPAATKRKSQEFEQHPGMPPMKKFKPPKPSAPSSTISAPSPHQMMHNAFMNGPTLSPQGQFSHPPANGHPQPPPGLLSAAKGATFINFNPNTAGYASPHSGSQNRPQPAHSPQPNHTPSKPPSVNGFVAQYSASTSVGATKKAPMPNGPPEAPTPSYAASRTPSTPMHYSPYANGVLPPSKSPNPTTLSPLDQRRLSPAVAPAPYPGYSPTKPPPTSPQPPAVPISPAVPTSGSPVMQPPPTAPTAAGRSPRKPSPPPAPALIPVNAAAMGPSWAPSPAAQLPASEFPFTKDTISHSSPLGPKPDLSPSAATTRAPPLPGPIPAPVPAPRKPTDTSPASQQQQQPMPSKLPVPPPFAISAAAAAPLPAPVQAPTKAAPTSPLQPPALSMPGPQSAPPLAASDAAVPPASPRKSPGR